MRLEIWASGSGSNAENIYNYFNKHPDIEVGSFASNRKNAGVWERANRLQIPCHMISAESFSNGEIIDQLKKRKVDVIILAGFLKLIPQDLIKAFPNKILNIHPALLPKYGGKGMYGAKVHEAVIDNNEAQSGISIHLVNEAYDEGEILSQHQVNIEPEDTAHTLAQKIHLLEYEFYPKTIETYIKSIQ